MNSREVRKRWAEQSGEYSPDYYAYYGPDERSERLRAALDSRLDRDATVLELGCSSGRHLAHLAEHGYENLFGIEINDDAFDVMADAYPDLAAGGTFYEDAIENVVPDLEDGRFDAVYSVETLQHIHPDDEWVFAELARIADELLVTVEIERAGGGRREADGDEDEGGNAIGGDGPEGEDDGEGETAVNYVNDEVPLYYRNWRRIFGNRGLVEVDSGEVKNDVLRAFRPES